MSDNRKGNGGFRPGSGRPSKSDEMNLIQNLDRFIDRDEALALLKEMMFEDKDFKSIQMYFKYVYGVPTKIIDLNVNQEQPLFLLGAEDELL